MIESVSTSPVQSVALRSQPQGDVAASAPRPAPSSNFINSRVRVDNLQNVAILEYRSSEGQVVRQYPTEAQIEAFKRAERLARQHTEQVHTEEIGHSSGGSGGGESHAAASAQPVTPSTGDIVAAAASYSPPSPNASSGGSTSTSIEA